MSPHELIVLTAHLALLAIGGALFVIDARTHRLPNRIVLPTLLGVALLVLIEAIVLAESGRLLRSVAGMLVLGGFFALLRLLSRGGLGGGDVKLAALLGLVLGWHSWSAVALGAASAFLLAALYALVLMTLRRADGKTRIAFGPWMLVGAALAIAVS